MIFRQVVAFAVLTGYPICHGHFVHQAGSSTSTSKQENTEYNALIDLLNPFFDNNCQQEAMAGSNDPQIETETTMVTCTGPIGEATLMATGSTNNLIPESLHVCSYGDDNTMKFCKFITFTGNVQQDMEEAETILIEKGHARHLQSLDGTYNFVINLLNKQYGRRKCYTYASGLAPSPVSITVMCSGFGGDATFTAQGSTNRIPKKLKVCSYGDYMKKSCQSMEFIGNEKWDMKKAQEIIVGGYRHLKSSN